MNYESIFESQLASGNIADHLTLRLMNRGRNPVIEKSCPHLIFEDLMAVPYWKLNDNAYIRINHDFSRRLLRMTDDEIMTAARSAQGKRHFTITGIKEALQVLIGDSVSKDYLTEMLPNDAIPLFVMTSEDRRFGAAAILSKETLRRAAKVLCETEYYVIPSSIHEVMLIPGSMVIDPADLKEKCIQVNESQVFPTEVLGDNIYRWNGHKLQMCNGLEDLITQRASEGAREELNPQMIRSMK